MLKFRLSFFVFAGLAQSVIVIACPCHVNLLGEKAWREFRAHHELLASKFRKAASTAMPMLPHEGGEGTESPWGGTLSQRWRPEAILANATSAALNRAWASPDTRDAVAAVAVKMLRSQFHPYGDGQSNAAVSFADTWVASRPPLVATRIQTRSGRARVEFRLDRSLSLKTSGIRLRLGASASDRSIDLMGQRDSEGNLVVLWDWDAPIPLLFVQPIGWRDWFPIDFRHPVILASSMLAQLPSASRAFTDGRPILDPERIGVQDRSDPTVPSATPFDRLVSHNFHSGYNTAPYNPQNIHAQFPNAGGLVTATGQGWTWVAEKPLAPFKVLYTCFERRRPDLEAVAKDGGVPSGGGWHEIGDPAETIFNSLEKEPVVVGWATTSPASHPPSGNFAYGLTDIATVRWLQPGEALMTARISGSGGQANFHWFAFHSFREICTEEWVHPCVPNDSNHMGMDCQSAP